jgi:peptidoglycan/LPS O-acetylase OafA/YrhL
VYLIHDPFRDVSLHIINILHPAQFTPHIALMIAACLSASMVLPAWAAYRFIERPGRAMIRRLGSQQLATPAVLSLEATSSTQ